MSNPLRRPLRLHLYLDSAVDLVPAHQIMGEECLLNYVRTVAAMGRGCPESEVPKVVVQFSTLLLIEKILTRIGGEMHIGIRRDNPYSNALAEVLLDVASLVHDGTKTYEPDPIHTAWRPGTTMA